jgi:predicted membrane channel-forming protein YqfA (hemolysin III family)
MLLTDTQIPEWYTKFEFIKTGYRRPDSPLRVFLSIFEWHNETLNIHTHLLPALWFIYKLYTIQYEVFFIESSVYAKFCILSGYMNAILLLIASAFAHTFHIINKEHSTTCWCYDFAGIIVCNLGRQYVDTFLLCITVLKTPLVFFGAISVESLFAFYCIYQIVYIDGARRYWGMIYPAISSIVLITPLIYISQKSDFFLIKQNIKPSVFREATNHSLSCSLYIFIAGLAFYKGKIPERFWNPRGIFDHCHSHVWHHVCIVCSIVSAMAIAHLLYNLE